MKYRLFGVLLAAAAAFGVPAAASAGIPDSSIYYAEAEFYKAGNYQTPLQKIEGGSIECRYSVTNETDAENAFSLVCGMYENDVLVAIKAETAELAAGENRILTAGVEVDNASGCELRSYLVRSLNVRTPLKASTVLGAKSRAKDVLSFSVKGVQGKVDNISGRIGVVLPRDVSLSGTTASVSVSQGAAYTIGALSLDTDITMTVTAEDKSTKNYIVRITQEPQDILYDFKGYADGTSPSEMTELAWSLDAGGTNKGGTVSATIQGETVVLKDLDGDSSNGQKIGLNSGNNAYNVEAPFEVSMEVKYELPEGTGYEKNKYDISYSLFSARNASNTTLCGVQPSYSSGKYVMQYAKNAGYTGSLGEIELGEWYTIKMYYYEGSDGKYYTDYTIIYDGEELGSIDEVPAGDISKMTKLYFSTTNGRQCIVTYDNINIRQIAQPDSWECEDFELSGTQTKAFTELSGDVSVSFDYTTAGCEGDWSVVEIGTSAKTAATLFCRDGYLYYIYNGSEYPLADAQLTPDTTHSISLKYINDTSYQNSRVDFYLDGVCIGNTVPVNTVGGIGKLVFRTAGFDTSVEGLVVQKLS